MREQSSRMDFLNFILLRKSIKLNSLCQHKRCIISWFIGRGLISWKMQIRLRTFCFVLRKVGRIMIRYLRMRLIRLTSTPSSLGTYSKPSSTNSASSTSAWTACPRTKSTRTVSLSNQQNNFSPRWCSRSRSNSIAPHPPHNSSATTHYFPSPLSKSTKATTKKPWI